MVLWFRPKFDEPGGHVQYDVCNVGRRFSRRRTLVIRVSSARGNWGATRGELDRVVIGLDRVATMVGEGEERKGLRRT